MAKESSIIGVQCRGCMGNLEKDVGVIIVVKDHDVLSIKCPFYDDNGEKCRPYSVDAEGKMKSLGYLGLSCYLKTGKNQVLDVDLKSRGR